MRQIASEKLAVILALKNTPIVLVACKKIGLSTSTFYRWRNSDVRFKKEVARAVMRGRENVSDIAEARLTEAVKKGNMRAVIYWLRTFRDPYKKTDKTIIEVKTKQAVTREPGPRRQRNGALLPSVDYSNIPPLSPKAEAQAMKIFEKMAKGIERENRRDEAVVHILYKKGLTKEEIQAVIDQMNGKQKLPTKGLDSIDQLGHPY